MFKKICLLPVAAAFFLAGCSTQKVDPYLGDSVQYIYAKGHNYLQKGNYNDALTAYQSLDSQYPFDPLTQQGDLETIYAEYANDNPALAVTAASRYLKIYPSGPNQDYAYYMMGVVNFENGRGFLQKYFPYNMSQHNANNYSQAFSNFATVINTYPSSPYASDARRRMIYLNNTLAQYQMNVADLEFKQQAYVAALNRAKNVIIEYPTSPVTEEALQMMIQCYKKLGLNDLAQSSEQTLQLNFPNATTQK